MRYPSPWNARAQDFTQWPGFSANGSDLLGRAPNLGEVYFASATFAPQQKFFSLPGIDYTSIDSANFNGLSALETLIRLAGPAKVALGDRSCRAAANFLDDFVPTECRSRRDRLPQT